MARIIGMDFGNVNILASIIDGMDENTRAGGSSVNITPPQRQMGINSTFYYSKKTGERYCDQAYFADTFPQNRVELLKRNIGKTFTLDGKTFEYDYALKKVAEYALNKCLEELENIRHETTNLVSLAYPAAFLDPSKVKLKQILEGITLRNGQKVKVVGMISEPAAAALDYLAVHSLGEKIVLVCDLGGGTYDLALVKAYPNGIKAANGSIKYYDCLGHNGINVGGSDFNDVIYNMVIYGHENELNDYQKGKLRYEEAEKIKIELSSRESSEPMLMVYGIFDEKIITRKDFAKASEDLLNPIIKLTRNMLEDTMLPNPDYIILTGGGANMAILTEAFERSFPNYKGKIKSHDPHYAISHGAARFGTADSTNNSADDKMPIRMRTSYAYGVDFIILDTDINAIHLMIPARTEYPYDSGYIGFVTIHDDQSAITTNVYQANTEELPKINGYESKNDWYSPTGFDKIAKGTYNFGRTVPKGTPDEERLVIDKDGVLHFYMREAAYPDREIEITAGTIK